MNHVFDILSLYIKSFNDSSANSPNRNGYYVSCERQRRVNAIKSVIGPPFGHQYLLSLGSILFMQPLVIRML